MPGHSTAGPIQRAASIWTSARLPEKRGVESTPFHPGLGVGAVVGKVFQEIGLFLRPHPGVGMLHWKKVAKAPLQPVIC